MIHHIFRRIFVVGVALILIGCTQSQESQNLEFVVTPEQEGQPAFINPSTSSNSTGGYPAPSDASGYPSPVDSSVAGYPAPVSEYSKDGRSRTAIQSFDLAHPVALDEFHSDAYLAAIAPSHIMLTNLGSPPVLPGWFFRFRRPESRREFIVHVVDDIITGTTLTESAMDVGPVEQPVDLSQVNLDSPDVLELFQKIGSERGEWSESVAYDLELVNLEGTNGPIWSVVNPTTQNWLFSVDAVTGEETNNPYQN